MEGSSVIIIRYYRLSHDVATSVSCSLGGPLSYGSPVVVFLDRGHPCFWNFYSIEPVDVVRAKSYVNCLFDPACLTMRIAINKLCFIPKRVVSGVVGISETAEIWERASRKSPPLFILVFLFISWCHL